MMCLEVAESRTAEKEAFKERLARVLAQSGYEETPPGKFDRRRREGRPVYSRRYPLGTNIYGADRKGDFILYHPEHYPECLVIEVRWQTVSGTTEQKFPFFVLTINDGHHPTVFVFGGIGFSDGAVEWLRDQAGKDRLLAVWDAGEFETRWREGGV